CCSILPPPFFIPILLTLSHCVLVQAPRGCSQQLGRSTLFFQFCELRVPTLLLKARCIRPLRRCFLLYATSPSAILGLSPPFECEYFSTRFTPAGATIR
ncbi:hypothetical protein DL93DRAFT_2136525, partial [Clavulina sp. PMI_390]